MGLHTLIDGRIELVRFLTPDGEPCEAAPLPISDEALLFLYKAMTRTRMFDGKAIALQRTGQLGTFASALGQEAVGIGVASAMEARDVLVPSYRDHAAQFLRGMTMTECLLYWGGDERGSDFKVSRQDFPNCVPVATQNSPCCRRRLCLRLEEGRPRGRHFHWRRRHVEWRLLRGAQHGGRLECACRRCDQQ